MPVRSILAVAAGRLVLLPLAGLALVAGSYRLGLLPSMDPTALVVMMMMSAVRCVLVFLNPRDSQPVGSKAYSASSRTQPHTQYSVPLSSSIQPPALPPPPCLFVTRSPRR